MRLRDLLYETFTAIRANRVRSLLTVLGIVIGISSVILTVGLGQGAQREVKEQIDALGSNLLIVSPGSSTSSSGVRGGFGSASTLTIADDGAVSGSTGCNRITGHATVSGSDIEFGPLATTRMARAFMMVPIPMVYASRGTSSAESNRRLFAWMVLSVSSTQ